eukprot:6485966-Amphidinium_carterae.1
MAVGEPNYRRQRGQACNTSGSARVPKMDKDIAKNMQPSTTAKTASAISMAQAKSAQGLQWPGIAVWCRLAFTVTSQ